MLSKIRLSKEEQKTLILIILAALILSVVCYNISFKPRLKQLRRLIPQASRLKTDLKTLKKDIANIENLKRQMSSAHQQAESAIKRFLPGNDPTPLMEELSRLARVNRVKIVSMNPVRAKEASTVAKPAVKPAQPHSPAVIPIETSVSINVKGGYHDIGKFIDAIESSQLFIKVIDIDINADYEDPLNHDAAVLVSAYALPE